MAISALRHEPVYESPRTQVNRVWLGEEGGTVITKAPLGPDAAARVRNETTILDRLTGVPGVVRLSERGRATATTLVIEDLGSEPLVTALPLDLDTAVRYAIELAGTIAKIHEHGVVHKDITPANVLLTGLERRPVLIDFECSSTAAEERPGFAHHREMVGTLAYLAPEQTGRTGLPVDQRADMYALGATLYEMIAGEPPFGTGEALQLVHDALVRVPVPLADRVPGVPAQLSAIVARLLEKEPDRRYQSASGLAHDLSMLREGRLRRLGERDYPARLAAPSRPVGRDGEIEGLHRAFAASLRSHDRGVLVCGSPGVGKSTVVNELRLIAAARNGWFVSGKFDQYRREAVDGAEVQALRALCRLLLAEPQAQLAASQERIGAALGTSAGLLAAAVPELTVLLGDVPPQPVIGDPLEAASRLVQAELELLRAVASPQRPVVMALDDLQWATASALELVDVLLGDENLRGLLIVGAYRSTEVDEAHPLTAMQSRWRRLDAAPPLLELSNLEPAGLGAMFTEMLRLPADRAEALARVVGERTAGNPYDSIELVNALRRDGVLSLGDSGWSWDDTAIRRYIGSGDVVDLLRDRIDALPAAAREILTTMAHLGCETQLDRLMVAASAPAAAVSDAIAPALEDGLLVLDADRIRFRHDRVQQAVYDGLPDQARGKLRLVLARRLDAAGYDADAAEQYLATLENVTDATELRRAATLFQAAAAQARQVTSYRIAERFLSAASDLHASLGTAPDDPSLIELDSARHAVLYSLSRYEEADAAYESFLRRGPDLSQRASVAALQMGSLTNRGRGHETLALGFQTLDALGFPRPEPDLAAEIGRRIPDLHAWIGQTTVAEDLARPEVTDPRVPAAALVLNRLGPAAYSTDPRLIGWTVLEGHRLWAEYGPCAPLPGLLAGAGVSCFGAPEDFDARARILRHVIAVGEARGYQPGTANAQMIYAQACGPWFEPVSNSVRGSQAARDLLLHYGDVQIACYAYVASISGELDCSPTLDPVAAEVESAIALTSRIGQHMSVATYSASRVMLRELRGEADPWFDEDAFVAANMPSNVYAVACLHVNLGFVAAILGDTDRLIHHVDAAAPVLFILEGTMYARGRLLSALALVRRLPTAAPDQRQELLARLDEERAWWSRRAARAPGNFGHLLHLIDAERAWEVGDELAALRAFEAASRAVEARNYPWHKAFIAERSGLCHMAFGLEGNGRWLLTNARAGYLDWGAAAKVAAMDREHRFLAAPAKPIIPSATMSNSVSAEAIDMMAILETSRTLSGETSLDRLYAVLTEQLGTLTGATTVHLELSAAPSGRADLPYSALRYVERTGETLLVHDATQDDRFARDPYFSGLARCSLLVVPVLDQGVPRGVLLLVNDKTAGAFTISRLDTVELIAGQLAVSLDKALLYQELEERVARRTQELEDANRQLEILSTTDALTKLANRRRFNEALDAEWARASRTRESVGVVIVDIDHFKLYNDHYGHLGGDECLRRVGSVLAQCGRRATDLACRYGGEEFAVVLSNTSTSGVAEVANQVRTAVTELAEPHALSSYGIVTVSVGYATMVPDGVSTPESLVRAADAALYRAKSDGRNRVEAAESGSSPD